MAIKSVSKFVAIALLALPTSTIGLSMIPSAVSAEKGGNGNRGNGNGQANRGNRDNGNREARTNANRDAGGNNGRGAIARELQGLNAAHASQNGLRNAAPNSMTGKLYAYQQSQLDVASQEAKVAKTTELLNALSNMTEERFKELNPDLDYAETLATTRQSLLNAESSLTNAETTTEASMQTLTGGRELSDAAMTELHQLLGL